MVNETAAKSITSIHGLKVKERDISHFDLGSDTNWYEMQWRKNDREDTKVWEIFRPQQLKFHIKNQLLW